MNAPSDMPLSPAAIPLISTANIPPAPLLAGGVYLAMAAAGLVLAGGFWRACRRRALPAETQDDFWQWSDLLLLTGLTAVAGLIPAGFLARLRPGVTPASLTAMRVLGMHIMVLTAALLIWRARRGRRARELRPAGSDPWRRQIRQGLLFYLAALPFILLAGIINHAVFHIFGYTPTLQDAAAQLLRNPDPATRLILITVAVITAPIFEELLFRRMALPLAARSIGNRPALLLTALVFAAIHLHGFAVLPLFVLAIFLGLAYIYSRSLITCITMHALFNAVNIVLLVVFDQA